MLKLTPPTAKKLRCSKGHAFISALPYALTLPSPFKLNGKVDWCMRCIFELFNEKIGVVGEDD